MENKPQDNDDNPRFTIRKVPLQTFLALLNDVYQSGADFIDINGYINDAAAQDEVTVSVPLGYMTDESQPGGHNENDHQHEEEEEWTVMAEDRERDYTKEEIIKLIKNV